ncbi:T9SS type A sorting domain-containing protein [Paraflavisolibacter sp. H34]|uniref:T9SS type A sorting domain-containing protein n=1 Tax=Huijunlia imazamoxiresistens TaxID=3127457 RepID=UPI0030173792
MKKVITVLFLSLLLNEATAQNVVRFFQHRFNLNYTSPQLRDEQFNSGIVTRYNYPNANDDRYFYVGIGTSYRNPQGAADRLRFTRMNFAARNVLNNVGYVFQGANNKAFLASGNSIAEVDNGQGNGGYVAVGAVTSNNQTGAVAPGGSDVLFVRLNANGNVVRALRIDFDGGRDAAWCIRLSNRYVNNQPTWLLCGASRRGPNNTDALVARVNGNGQVLWAARYNFARQQIGGAHCMARQLTEDNAGNIYVVGSVQNAGRNNIQALAFRLGPGGALQWANSYNQPADNEFMAVRRTQANTLIVGGFTNNGGSYNMQVVNLGLGAGAILFQNVLRAGNGQSKCHDILQAPNGTFYLAGPFYNNQGTFQMMYHVGPGGNGLEWLHYNRMNTDVGFGLDHARGLSCRGKNGNDCPGIAYFSSMRNPSNAGFSDGFIMKTGPQIRTCNFTTLRNPANQASNLQRVVRLGDVVRGAQSVVLNWASVDFADRQICRERCCANEEEDDRSEIITSIEGPDQEQLLVKGSVSVSPLPAGDHLRVQFRSLPAGTYQLRLHNMEGKLMLQQNNVYNNGSSLTELNLSSVPSGFYLLIITKGPLVLKQKVVRQ